MSNFNSFEQKVDTILANEAAGDILNAAQQALQKMTPGSDLFAGPGLVTNKYDAKKRYYPNIRASLGGWKNISLDKASSNFINKLKELRNIKSWSPKWTPQGTPYGKIISNNYSSDFVPNTEKAFKEAIKALVASYERMPLNTDLQNQFNSIIEELKTIDPTTDPKKFKEIQDKKNELFKDLQIKVRAGKGQGAERKLEDCLGRKQWKKGDEIPPDCMELLNQVNSERQAMKLDQYKLKDAYKQPSNNVTENENFNNFEKYINNILLEKPSANDAVSQATKSDAGKKGAVTSKLNAYEKGLTKPEDKETFQGLSKEEQMQLAGVEKPVLAFGDKQKVDDVLARQAQTVAGESEQYTYEMGELQQQHVNMMRKEFEAAFQKFEEIMSARMSLAGDKGDKSTPGAANSMIDPPDENIQNSVLRSDGTVYRDRWDEFLNNLQNAIIGAGQRGWSGGADLLTILRGKTLATAKRGEQELKEIGSIDPKTLQYVHENIMMPLFLKTKNPTLIYATSEQWDQISQGGRLYKAATGLGAQTYTAGQNRPKVAL